MFISRTLVYDIWINLGHETYTLNLYESYFRQDCYQVVNMALTWFNNH